jgi:hypothetical protein
VIVVVSSVAVGRSDLAAGVGEGAVAKSPLEIVLGGEVLFDPESAAVLERLAEGEQAELVLERPRGSSGLKAAIAVWN